MAVSDSSVNFVAKLGPLPDLKIKKGFAIERELFLLTLGGRVQRIPGHLGMPTTRDGR